MAKKINFPLEMEDGHEARYDLEEYRAHFTLVKAIEHFTSGKLVEWLEYNLYKDEANALGQLDKNAPDFQRRLCEILGVEIPETADAEPDVDAIHRTQEKETMLRQKTSDEKVIANAAKTAFHRGDVIELLKGGEKTIYLCGDAFDIPISEENVKYIGVLGTPKIIIKASTREELANKGITFENVELPEYLQEKKTEATKPCPKCGKENPVSAKFCNDCGSLMDKVEKIDVSSPTAEVSEGKVCPRCGQKAQENDGVFCTKCGVKFIEATEYAKIRVCPNCGEKLRGNGKFCTTCGTSLEGAREIKEDDFKKNATDKEKNPLTIEELKYIFTQNFPEFNDEQTWRLLQPEKGETTPYYYNCNFNDMQKKLALNLICKGQYEEKEIIQIAVSNDCRYGWAVTQDSFCIVHQKHLFLETYSYAGIIKFADISRMHQIGMYGSSMEIFYQQNGETIKANILETCFGTFGDSSNYSLHKLERFLEAVMKYYPPK